MTDEKVKRPASQYYWGDWFKDLALQSCTLPARGLWHEMNCLQHQGEPYGHLTMPNGKTMSPAQLANLCKIPPTLCKRLIGELEEAGVFSRTAEGVIYSRRMVRDEAVRETRAQIGRDNGIKGKDFGAMGAEHGVKGGRPRRDETPPETPPGEPGQKPPQNPHPSSASSSSSASSTSTTGEHSPHSDPNPASATAPGLVCRAVKLAGLGQVNPSDPRLLALLARGATVDHFVSVVPSTLDKHSPWAYLLTVVEGQITDAAAIAAGPRATAAPQRKPTRADVQAATLGALTGRSNHPERTDDADRQQSAIDVESRRVD